MERWTAQHRVFVVETFFKNAESVTTTQRKFRLQFNIPRNGAIPTRNTILLWVQNFRETGSALEKNREVVRRRPRHLKTLKLCVMQFNRAPADLQDDTLSLLGYQILPSDAFYTV